MLQVHQPSLTFSHQDIPKAKNHVTHIYPPTTSAGMAVSYWADGPIAVAVVAAVSLLRRPQSLLSPTHRSYC